MACLRDDAAKTGALHGGSNPSAVARDHVVLHIDEHVGRFQPAILARIVVEQEQEKVRQSTIKVQTEVAMGLHGYGFAERP